MARNPRIDPSDYDPKIGDRWENRGPIGTTVVRGVQLPGAPNYDGGLPGLSVKVRQVDGWKKFFKPAASAEVFAERMQSGLHSLRLMHEGKPLKKGTPGQRLIQ